MKTMTTYNGNDIFGINFNLYPYYENINPTKTLKNILVAFRDEFAEDIKTVLLEAGIKYGTMKTFSPREYNYMGDSIDITLKVVNKEKLMLELLKNFYLIDKKLQSNKSCDGYLALTPDDAKTELLQLLENENYEISIIALETILQTKIDFKGRFTIEDYFIY